MKYFKYLLLSFLLLIILFNILFFTEFGLHIILTTVHYFFPAISIQASNGRIRDKIILENIVYSTPTIDINIKKLNLTWNPVELINQTLFIQSVNIDGIHIHFIKENNGDNIDNSKQHWIKNLKLNNAAIKNITLYSKNTLISSIDNIIIYPALKEDNNDFLINIKRGLLYGTYHIEDLSKKIGHVIVHAKHLNCMYLWPNIKTDLSFTLNVNYQNALDFQLKNLQGTFLNNPLFANINIHQEADIFYVNTLNINIHNTRVEAYGTIGNISRFNWKMEIPSLKDINKDMQGKLFTKGTLRIYQDQFNLQSILKAENIKFKQFRLRKINLKIDSVAKNNVHVKGQLTHLKMNQLILPTVSLFNEIKLINHSIYSNFMIQFQKTNTIQAHISFSDLLIKQFKKTPLKGQIKISLNNLSWLKISQLQHLKAHIDGKMQLAGTMMQPLYHGSFILSNGSVKIPSLNIYPHNIQAKMMLSSNSHVNFEGLFHSGKGKGSFKGETNIKSSPYDLKIGINGENLEIIHTKEYQITASPQLILTFLHDRFSMEGKIVLPFLRINLDNYVAIVNLPTEFEVLGSRSDKSLFQNLKILTEIKLTNEAFISYKNLTANLSGNLMVYQHPGGLPSGRGEITIKKGTYKTYNRVFDIKKGRLIYVENLLTNPGLNIKAILRPKAQKKMFGFNVSSEAETIKVGLSISGTLDQPIISFFSEPTMSQENIISYIAFGQSLENLSSLDTFSALNSISTNLSDPTNEKTSWIGSVVDKIGLLNPNKSYHVGLPLNKYWQIKTETNLNEIGVDLLYKHEVE